MTLYQRFWEVKSSVMVIDPMSSKYLYLCSPTLPEDFLISANRRKGMSLFLLDQEVKGMVRVLPAFPCFVTFGVSPCFSFQILL